MNKKKKPFTLSDIKKDINFSMFVCRLYYTNIAFDWILVNEDDITKSKISTYVQHLKNFGLIRTLNYVKLSDNFTEILNEIMPNFNKYVDNKCPIVYQQTKTLIESKDLIADIRNHWSDNEWFIIKIIELENLYNTMKTKNLQLKELNQKDLTRIKKFSNGVIAEVRTSRFWNLRLAFKRNQDVLLIPYQPSEQEIRIREERKARVESIKGLTMEQKNEIYLKRLEEMKK